MIATTLVLALSGMVVLPSLFVDDVPTVSAPRATPTLPLLTGFTVMLVVAVLLAAPVALVLAVSVPLTVGTPVTMQVMLLPAGND